MECRGIHGEDLLADGSIGIYFLADFDLENATTDETRRDVASNYRAGPLTSGDIGVPN
jgi:hypothetical protein